MMRMSGTDKMAVVVKAVVWTTVASLFIGLIMFEQVNYVTTNESLAALFGKSRWIDFLTWAVVLTDIAALARIFTPETDSSDENGIVKTLWTLWLVVSTLDAGFNWFFAALEMESNKIRVPTAMHGFEWVLPVLIAAIIWGVQFGLLYFFGLLLDSALHTKDRTRRIAQPMPGGNRGSNQPKTNNPNHTFHPVTRPQPGANMHSSQKPGSESGLYS